MQTQINTVIHQAVQSKIASPCIKLCRLHNGVCIGCNRTKQEIYDWFYGDDSVKNRILNRINMNIKFVKKHENAVLPKYTTEGSAGADITSVGYYEIAPGSSTLVDTGLACVIPKGYEIQVRPRSGLALKNQITVLNTPGTIDSDYTGEIKVILINHSNSSFKISPGDRIAQIVVAPSIQASFAWTEAVAETSRGSGGFGSTGV